MRSKIRLTSGVRKEDLFGRKTKIRRKKHLREKEKKRGYWVQQLL